MGWYDLFARFYDRSLEDLYRPYRGPTVAALRLNAGATVLDLACGTGQNFDELEAAIGADGHLIGLDRSKGMLSKAMRRIHRRGWDNATLIQAEATALDASLLEEALGTSRLDGVLCTLGLSAMPDWQDAFARSFELLVPGGRYVIFDVFAAERVFQTRMVELVARADLSRAVWKPLEAATRDFEMSWLEGSPKQFGGRLLLASGTRT